MGAFFKYLGLSSNRGKIPQLFLSFPLVSALFVLVEKALSSPKFGTVAKKT
jgi:hypothetical protein